jgi:hypothetical protein
MISTQSILQQQKLHQNWMKHTNFIHAKLKMISPPLLGELFCGGKHLKVKNDHKSFLTSNFGVVFVVAEWIVLNAFGSMLVDFLISSIFYGFGKRPTSADFQNLKVFIQY